MNFLKLAHIGWPALVTAMAASACSGNPAPPPQAFVYALVQNGTTPNVNDSAVCGESGAVYLALGNATSPKPTPVADGATYAGGKAAVSCTVDGSGGGFQVQLSVVFNGQNGGSIAIEGHVDGASGGGGIHGGFTQQGQSFTQNDCNITYTYNNMPLSGASLPAQGRIWGHIDCPNAVVQGQYVTLPDGTSVQRACDASADFYFENCD